MPHAVPVSGLVDIEVKNYNLIATCSEELIAPISATSAFSASSDTADNATIHYKMRIVIPRLIPLS